MSIRTSCTILAGAFALTSVLAATAAAALAATPPAASNGASTAGATAGKDAAPQAASYDKLVKDAQKQEGLFTIYRKEGHLYLELKPEQLDKDYLEHVTTGNGLAGYGIYSGDDFIQEARLVRFQKVSPKAVALIWPQVRLLATPGTPLDAAVNSSTASSVEAVAPLAAEDDHSKAVVIDASFLLGDVLDLANTINGSIADPGEGSPEGSYRLDPTRSYFGPSKAFPKNVVLEADQTFAAAKPDVINTVVDPRAIQMRIKYNFTEILSSPDYMPRLVDERVGYWTDPHLSFDRDSHLDNRVLYVLRWDLKASDPSKPLSPATKPIVYTISNTIPDQYRPAIRDAVLEWNKAFERIGISDAVRVQDQPNDPSFDPDDIRYNVIRWLTEANGGGFAEAQIEWDPRTGEIFRGGVLIDADIVRYGNFAYADIIGPARALDPDPAAMPPVQALADSALWDPAAIEPAAYGHAGHHRRAFLHRDAGMAQQAAFGALALALYGESVPPNYAYDYLKAIVLHEVGHDFGLQHNFIGHNAFTASELKDKSFTRRNGVASSVMEYAPINLWPKGSRQGDFFQATLGPYDYHVIHWGYAPVPGAKSPWDEVATLDRWASAATNPKYNFASDEDVAYDGHAVDPRISQFMLTGDSISWCETQLGIQQNLIRTLDSRFPRIQQPWEQERLAFLVLVRQYGRCAGSMTHYVAGEYLSRARRGDSGAPTTPLIPVPRGVEVRAFRNLDRYLFSDTAWRIISPETLKRTVYTEYAPFADFGYFPTARHDVSLSALVGTLQNRALAYMFSPLVLQRLNDLSYKAPAGATMSLADLFSWTQTSVFGDLAIGNVRSQTPLRRTLQRGYARMLARMTVHPYPGTPYDAQSLARHELVSLAGNLRRDLAHGNLDLQTRAHLEALQVDVNRALDARMMLSSL